MAALVGLRELVFVAIYILVDIVYVSFSKPVYADAVKKISGKEIPVGRPMFFIVVGMAYAAMVVGWLLLVVPAFKYMVSIGVVRWIAGLVCGLAYGVALYGVYNFTMYATFEGWDNKILARDLVWGISWATLLTVGYATL